MNITVLNEIIVVLERVRDRIESGASPAMFHMGAWVSECLEVPCGMAACAGGWYAASPEGKARGMSFSIGSKATLGKIRYKEVWTGFDAMEQVLEHQPDHADDDEVNSIIVEMFSGRRSIDQEIEALEYVRDRIAAGHQMTSVADLEDFQEAVSIMSY